MTEYLDQVKGVRAFCDMLSVVVEWDDELDVEANHERAACQLIQRLGLAAPGNEMNRWRLYPLPLRTPYGFCAVQVE